MKLIFDREEETLSVIAGGKLWVYPAGNNVDSRSEGIWPPGIYRSRNLIPVTGKQGKENGAYGPWFLLFEDFMDIDDDHRSGMGIHAGRSGRKDGRGREGHLHATYGCIRTTPDAMSQIVDLAKGGERLPVLWVS